MLKHFKAVIGGVERTFAYSNGALYRVGSLDRPPTIADLATSGRSYSAAVAWLWACIHDKKERARFQSPEDLAEVIKLEEVGPAVDALISAIVPNEKNADGSTPAPSPVSS